MDPAAGDLRGAVSDGDEAQEELSGGSFASGPSLP